jgi:flavin reductase (DIM6/NTAB) family NADH-FMN oxidoreductase RutF
VNEFEVAGLEAATARSVDAPYVADAPAVLECRLALDLELPGAANVLLVGEVLTIRLAERLRLVDGTLYVDTASLDPVGRLWGGAYQMGGEIRVIPRPRVGRGGSAGRESGAGGQE